MTDPTAPGPDRVLWIDAGAGIAGDMLLAALVDAGASLGAVRAAVEAVIPGAVALSAFPVTRAGQRATKVEVARVAGDQPHRTWATIRDLLERAELAGPTRERALATFARLADAEGRVHGVPAEQIHFHEVGAWDSIADVVGVAAALTDLGVGTVSASAVALGSGRIPTAHGDLGVPVPAVLELSAGWRVLGGGEGELTTPTGMALVRTLAERCQELPAMTVVATGVGAGTKDVVGRANVTRVVLGQDTGPSASGSAAVERDLVVVEANVDDLDPRLWPGVLEALLAAGALDAWLTPVLAKKGRPAHTVSALSGPGESDRVLDVLYAHTSTLGARRHAVRRPELARGWVDVELAGQPVPVKVGHRDQTVRQATPEFEPVAALAARQGRPVREVLAEAQAAAYAAGLRPGEPVPPDLRPTAG